MALVFWHSLSRENIPKMIVNNKVYLASKSPRRRELISQVFKNIEFIDAPLDEPRWSREQSPREYLELCLREKMRVGIEALSAPSEASFILVADTIVVLGKEVMGKPVDRPEARQMLQKLSGQWHIVQTGITLGFFQNGKWKFLTRITETRVRFKKLSAQQIKNYVASGEPMDKAGAYGFQAKGLQLVDRIEGPYSNIIGLPVGSLRAMAEELIHGSTL